MAKSHCPNCGHQLKVTVESAAGHRYDEPVVLDAEQRRQILCVNCFGDVVPDDAGPVRCASCLLNEKACACEVRALAETAEKKSDGR